MNKSRLEAFSDGVFAIIITIMVLELKIPEGTSWDILRPMVPTFICYLLSFVMVGIYWNNHHHLMHTARRINASIMWANMHILFWLSLIPFATSWMGRTNFDRVTVAVYGALAILCGLSYTILSKAIAKTNTQESALSKALAKGDTKGIVSIILYGASIPLALYVHPLVSAILFGMVAIIWLVPSKEIEQALEKEHH